MKDMRAENRWDYLYGALEPHIPCVALIEMERSMKCLPLLLTVRKTAIWMWSEPLITFHYVFLYKDLFFKRIYFTFIYRQNTIAFSFNFSIHNFQSSIAFDDRCWEVVSQLSIPYNLDSLFIENNFMFMSFIYNWLHR
jgi:hypothetical protein